MDKNTRNAGIFSFHGFIVKSILLRMKKKIESPARSPGNRLSDLLKQFLG